MLKESDVVREFHDEYYTSSEFRAWQNSFACDIYKRLAAFTASDKLQEVAKVTALCEAMSNRNFRGLNIESRMIHKYNTSGVSFDYMGKSSKKELGDMAIVSMVTIDRQIVLLKTAFIQNKDTKTHDWKIDHEQLFLLKNFPTFTGERGMLLSKTFTFLNHSGTLGNFGLFLPNGDMTFLTAQDVFCNQQNNAHIHFDSIRNGACGCYSHRTLSGIQKRNPYKGYCNYSDCIECRYCRSCSDCMMNSHAPFFGKYSYALDVHEVVRELTYFNIGELSWTLSGNDINEDLYHCTNIILAAAFGYSISEGYFNRDSRQGFNHSGDAINMSVILNHLELKGKYLK